MKFIRLHVQCASRQETHAARLLGHRGRKRGPKMTRTSRIGGILLILLAASTRAYKYHEALPGQYVLQLHANCNTSDEWMEVAILTDLNIVINIHCKDNYTEQVVSFDQIHFYFDIVFSGDSNVECVFNKKVDSETYTMIVETAWGEPEATIRPVVEPYLITCTYDPYMNNTSPKEQIGDGLVAPKEIQNNLGVRTTSVIGLSMVDIRGDVITNQIHRGRLVYLLGNSDGIGGESGLRAVSCDAVGNNGSKYAVLRAGCGDGIVFGQREGFLTQNLSVTSPYFSIFTLTGSTSVRFSCNFTTCTHNCDGSSCATVGSRKKRSTGDVYIAESDDIIIELGDHIEEIEVLDNISYDLEIPRDENENANTIPNEFSFEYDLQVPPVLPQNTSGALSDTFDLKDGINYPITPIKEDVSVSKEFDSKRVPEYPNVSEKTEFDDFDEVSSVYMWWKSPVAILGLAAVLSAIFVFGIVCYFRKPKSMPEVYF